MVHTATIVLAIALAVFFGYSFTLVPVLRPGLALGAALGIALAADTISITVMEIIDNAILLIHPRRDGCWPRIVAVLGRPRRCPGRSVRGHRARQPRTHPPRPRTRRGPPIPPLGTRSPLPGGRDIALLVDPA